LKTEKRTNKEGIQDFKAQAAERGRRHASDLHASVKKEYSKLESDIK